MSFSQKKHVDVRRMVALALFAAMAYACTFLPFLHIKVSFLTFDAKDAITTVAGMCFGPGAAGILSLLVAALEAITIGQTGIYGFLMNIISSFAFTVPAAWIYRYHKTTGGALFSLGCSVVITTATMMGFNLLITPLFMRTTTQQVLQMIPTLLLPFNLTKSVLNAALVLVLYKPMVTALRRTRLMATTRSAAEYRLDRKTVTMLLIGLGLMALSLAVFFVVLKGTWTAA